MNERRIARLQEQIKARIAEVLMREIADPGLGLVTVTRVELDREFLNCKAYWSVLGDGRSRARSEQVLRRATAFVQREVARVLHTRTVPKLRFVFDESIAGAIEMQQLLRNLEAERRARESRRGGPASGSDPIAPG
ncbi:MAG: 30S ribosome-binding factor RbfA [Planctomycetota bacterium]